MHTEVLSLNFSQTQNLESQTLASHALHAPVHINMQCCVSFPVFQREATTFSYVNTGPCHQISLDSLGVPVSFTAVPL